MSVSLLYPLPISFLLSCPAFLSFPPLSPLSFPFPPLYLSLSSTPQGTTFPFSACGHAFLPNADMDSPDELFQHNIIHTNMDQLMDVMKLLVSSCRNGKLTCYGI